MELTVRGINKSFGAGNVLSGVDFHVRGGEICALLGENGAGKSTLMNIVGGVLAPDAGTLSLDGKPCSFSCPADSLDAGIAFIHQELNLVNDLAVYENMYLSAFPKKGIFIDRAKMIAETKALFEKLGMDIDPNAMVGTLDASYKQFVEIAKALRANASVIIMDEPTTSLTAPEIRRVFDIMRTLKHNGIAMIFISHKLDEVMEICDRYTVLRNGVVAGEGSIADTSVRALAAMMVGHEVVTKTHISRARDQEVFRLEGLSNGRDFHDISLYVREGEILGVTGLHGDGRSELFETVFGVHGGAYTGTVTLSGKMIHPKKPHEALAEGMAYLARNRKENAVIPDMSAVDNGTVATLERLRKLCFIDFPAQKNVFAKQVDELHIKLSDPNESIVSLSGGNQQKVILARWLLAAPKVLVLDNPTQGVDIGAKEEIYTIIESLAEKGMAVIVLSAEAQEIIRVCDRSLVMYHGHIVTEVSGEDMNERQMMYYATGGKVEGK